jgi:hypothetical protein
MIQPRRDRLPSRIEAEVQERATRTMRLAFARAIKRNAMPKWAELPKHKRNFLRIYRKSAIKNRFASAYGRSGHDFFQVDHIVPLGGENVCGLMVPWNLHVIPAIVNNAKSTIIVEEWHNKMPDDGRKQLKAAQEKNKRDSEGYLKRKQQREAPRIPSQVSSVFDVLFR